MMKSGAVSLVELSALPPRDFVHAAYDKILGRSPTLPEQDEMLSALMQGNARTWLVGKLRYGAEGRSRSAWVPGLRIRYIAQRLFRVPGIGPVLEWVNALARLPLSLRHLRALAQFDAERLEQIQQRNLDRFAEIERLQEDLGTHRRDDRDILIALEKRHEELLRLRQNDLERIAALEQRHGEMLQLRQNDLERIASLERDGVELSERTRSIVANVEAEARHRQADHDRINLMEGRFTALSGEIDGDRVNHQKLDASVHGLDNSFHELDTSFHAFQSKVDSIFPPALDDVLEVRGMPLVALAKERFGLPQEAQLAALTQHERYAMFETVFYESPAVSAKQRVYLPYLNLELAQQWPFLDLGCGRGEFLRILRDEGIAAVGVDINPTGITRLRAEGFDAVEQDLVAFLEADRRVFCGASLLQVAEHLTDSQIERMLALVAARLAPGAVFIMETPNPICGLALSVFHTDSTHLRPLPPERMRYEIEAAGFEQTRTLFQARIPHEQFAGPDPRAYYADYAIIASRASS